MATNVELPTGEMDFIRWATYRWEHPEVSAAHEGNTGMRYQVVYAYPSVPSNVNKGTDIFVSGGWDRNSQFFRVLLHAPAHQ